MEELGDLTGLLIIGLFVLEAFRFVLKQVFKHYGKWIKENTKFHPALQKVMALNRTFHPWIGYLIVLLIPVHVAIQTGFQYFSPSGLVAGLLMTTEVIIGFLGEKVLKKPRPKAWVWAHRLMPIAVMVAILIHI